MTTTRLAWVLGATAMVALSIGLWSVGAEHERGTTQAEIERDVSRLDEMYSNYLAGTVVGARPNMLKAVTYILPADAARYRFDRSFQGTTATLPVDFLE